MPLTTVSVLKLVEDGREAQRLYESALAKTEEVAEAEFEGAAFTIRDLLPSDMPGLTANLWAETAGTAANAYATTTAGNGGAIADDTILCLYAFTLETTDTPSTPDVTVMRVTVGASLRAQLSLYDVMHFNADHPHRKGYLDSPIIITKNQNLTIDEFTETATQTYEPVWYGFTAEKVGRVIEA